MKTKTKKIYNKAIEMLRRKRPLRRMTDKINSIPVNKIVECKHCGWRGPFGYVCVSEWHYDNAYWVPYTERTRGRYWDNVYCPHCKGTIDITEVKWKK